MTEHNWKNRKVEPYPGTLSKTDKYSLPSPFRCMIVGASGSGKTTLLYTLIVKDWGIPFRYLYIFTKSMDQPIYQGLQKTYEKLSGKEGEEIAYFFENCEELIPVDECNRNSLVVFDDCVNIQQHIIKDYFSRGCPRNISTIYLTQCYNKVDVQLIRSNTKFLCVFEQIPKYLKAIHTDIVGSDFTLYEFKLICESCWKEEYGFLAIDLTKKLNKGKYSKKLELEI